MSYITVEFSGAAAPLPPSGPGGGLKDFGFDEGFERDYFSVAETGDIPARVVEVRRGRLVLVVAAPEGGSAWAEAVVSGRLGGEAAAAEDLPAVGDWVAVRPGPGWPRTEGPLSVRAVVPRRSALLRKAPGDTAHDRVESQILAANVDTAFIVAAAGQDFNPRRIERYLALAWEAGVRPVIVVTKADLAEDPATLVAEAEALAPGEACFAVSALRGEGLGQLAGYCPPGKTFILLGSSGAGKSTLLNALAGSRLADTGEVRADDERGRHTTTHRELWRLDSGALAIDTPGLREIQLWAGEEAVDAIFADIEAFAAECRFRDCGHGSEPGCAVRTALAAGEIEEGRYASWLKLRKEVAFLATRTDPAAARAERDRWKAINKSMRGYSKERRALQGRSR
jgi:ribosome biogenesis GTPase